MPEECWKKDSHVDPPLDCLTCERISDIPKELVYEYDSLDGAFYSGIRHAMFELIQTFQNYSPCSEEQQRVIKAIGFRQQCAFDRGVSYEDLLPYLQRITKELLSDSYDWLQ